MSGNKRELTKSAVADTHNGFGLSTSETYQGHIDAYVMFVDVVFQCFHKD